MSDEEYIEKLEKMLMKAQIEMGRAIGFFSIADKGNNILVRLESQSKKIDELLETTR